MPKPADRPSAKDLLASLTSKDKSEAKHQGLFFVPPGKPEPRAFVTPDPVLRAPLSEKAAAIKGPILAVAPPTDEELGVTWVDRLKKLLEHRSVVLVVADANEVKLLPIDDAAFALAAKALQTRAGS